MVVNKPIHFQLNTADPRGVLWTAIRNSVTKDREPKWLPCYDSVAAWLGDNQGRGLICVGSCSLGKSVICAQALPSIFHHYFDLEAKVVLATEMNQQIDDLLQYCAYKRIIIIDDLGTEDPLVVKYGNRRHPFCELVNKAEITGTLLIITTNLRTTRHDKIDYPSIEAKYGVPTLERLKAITKVAFFQGEGLRA